MILSVLVIKLLILLSVISFISTSLFNISVNFKGFFIDFLNLISCEFSLLFELTFIISLLFELIFIISLLFELIFIISLLFELTFIISLLFCSII